MHLLAALFIASSTTAWSADLPILRAKIDSGIVEGVAFGSEGSSAAFLGIPYAAPPVGMLRWSPPRPVERWDGVRAAKDLGPSCPQQAERYPRYWKIVVTAIGGDPSVVPPLGQTSEDCLSLNVWTSNLGGTTKQPVLVWIHGARFIASRGGDEAAVLAKNGAVVVTVNYRLGLLGFLAHPALSKESPHGSSGNYGLLDQIEALRWIQRNIAAFGGDPNRVTVFGNSGGAVSILYLLSSPLAQGFIQAAIVESTSGSFPLVKLSAAESAGQEVMKDVIPAEGDVVAAMRAVSVDTLLAKNAAQFVGPIEDGWVVSDLGRERSQGLPMIMGANQDELTIAPLLAPQEVPQTREAYRDLIQEVGTPFAKQLLAINPVSSEEAVQSAALRYLTDRDYVCASRYIAGKRAGPTWLYLLSVPTAATPGGEQLGSFHGADMRLLFNLDFGVPEGPAARHDGELMRRYWVQFAATGDPNVHGLPEWPRYQVAKPQYLHLGDPIRTVSDGGTGTCGILGLVWDNTSKDKTKQPASFVEAIAVRNRSK
jgi:para-nitrobenzyl esterase